MRSRKKKASLDEAKNGASASICRRTSPISRPLCSARSWQTSNLNDRQTAAARENGTALQSTALEGRAAWLLLARADLVSANDKIDSLRHELLSLLLSSDRSIVPDSSSVAGISTMGTPQEIDTARPELVALQHAGESIDEARKALRYRHFPTIACDVGFRYGNPGLNMGMDQFMGWGIVGLTASWNLFDGFKSRAQDAQLQRQLDYIDIARTRALETMRRTFEQARMQLNSARGRLTACQASEAAAAALAGERKN